MLPPLFAVAGGLLGLAQGAFGGSKNKQKRMEEVYNPMALGQQLQARDANANLNPEAAGRAAMQQNTATQGAAVGSALNATAGQMANSGEMGNGVGQGVAMSQAAQAAAAPYAQTNAQIAQGVMGQKQQQVDQSSQIGSRIADLSNHVSYYNSAEQNPGGRLLGGLVGGLNAATNIFGLINGKDASTTTTDGEQPPVETQTEDPAAVAGQAVAQMAPPVAERQSEGITNAGAAGQAAAAFGMGLKKKTGIDPNDPNYLMQNFNLMKGRPFSFK